MKNTFKAWGVFKRGKLGVYDAIPLIYRSKQRAKDECSIWINAHEEVRKVKVIIEEIK